MRALALALLAACSFQKPADVPGVGGDAGGDASRAIDGSVQPTGDAQVDAGAITSDAGFDTPITSFQFLKVHNGNLPHDITATITGTTIDATGYSVNVASLVPTFATTSQDVEVVQVTQQSGISPQSFAMPVQYVVKSQNGSIATYTVNFHNRSLIAAPVVPTVATNPTALAVGDFDGDSKPDLVVAIGTTITVLRNTTAAGAATPSFAATSFTVDGANVTALAAADIDGDHRPDIIVGTSDNTTGLVTILNTSTGLGSIAFNTSGQQSFPGFGVDIGAIAVADLNNDGKLDVVVTNRQQEGITIGINSTASAGGTVTFNVPLFYSAGPTPTAVTIAPYDGNATPDILISSQSDQAVDVLLSDTAQGGPWAQLGVPTALATSQGTAQFALAHFDAGTTLDVAAANTSAAEIDLQYQTASTHTPTKLATTGPTTAVATGDLDGDGVADLVALQMASATSGNFISFVNNGTGTFAAATTTSPATTAAATGSLMVTADFAGTGLPGFAVLLGNKVEIAQLTSN